MLPKRGLSMKNLLIIGAGQYGMVAKEIAESMELFGKISFLDDNNPTAIGKINDIDKFIVEYDSAVVAIGNSQLRLKLLESLCSLGYDVPCLIHKRAFVAPSAKIGKGSFVEPMAVVHTGVIIENGCIISAGTIVNHNSIIHKGCHLNCGSIVTARTEIKACTTTECGSICGV